MKLPIQGGTEPLTLEKPPLVSVVIPCHNYARFLAESIQSALNQTYPNVEVIVVDDESTDDTSSVAEGFPAKYIRINHVGSNTPAHTQNFALKLCSGEFAIFLGADDRLRPEYIEKCYEAFTLGCRRDKAVGFVWTGAREFGDFERVSYPRVGKLVYPHDAFADAGGQIGAILVPISVYKNVGLYDEALPCYEDQDWVIRALLKGYHGVSVREPLHEYRHHGGNLTTKEVNLDNEAKLWSKYPGMRQYLFVRNRIREIKLFLVDNRRFRMRLYNRLTRRQLAGAVNYKKSLKQRQLITVQHQSGGTVGHC